MVAEERITTKFAALVAAHPPEQETAFLATQQVDEARHMQFYARFREEVITEPQTIAAHVERAREQVSDSFRELFDGALVELHDELVANPGDLAAKAPFITLYHLVLESALGLTTFKFVTDYLNGERLLPGFVDGYSKIHHDETRHIGYGVWFLRETVREGPELADTVRETPATAAPPGRGVAEAARQRQRVGRAARRHSGRDPRVRPRRPIPAAQADRRPARDGPELTEAALPLGPAPAVPGGRAGLAAALPLSVRSSLSSASAKWTASGGHTEAPAVDERSSPGAAARWLLFGCDYERSARSAASPCRKTAT